ncbi:hypothetical protein [Methylocystis rosea]|uniref:hypothetical protein n=1 Tax=Methylocystis rosea TaxID=173366 RepID=UPI00039FB285|nr:hypothetical protein [Methylocystis rosea]
MSDQPLSALERAMERIAKECHAAALMAFDAAAQRLVDSNWLYRDTASRALNIDFGDVFKMNDADIRARAEERAASERKRINHYSHNRPRYLACLELAEAAKRRMEKRAAPAEEIAA